MNNQDLLNIGFKEFHHYTVAGSLLFDLGRNRHLSAGNIGTPNEILCICEIDAKDNRKINDIIVVHNYDYDGYLTEDKIRSLIKGING